MSRILTCAALLSLFAGCNNGDPGPGDSGPREAGPVDAARTDGGGDLDAPGIDGGGSDVDAGGEADGGTGPACTTTAECDDGNACNGDETCGASGTCTTGSELPDGTTCDADGEPTTDEICVGTMCGASRCGDGYLDSGAGEECDDANDVLGDGCDDCAYSCEDAGDCDDGETCNGTESCGTDHACAAGTPEDDGTTCNGTTGRCLGGSCAPVACTTNPECDDGDPCNGPEVCAAATGTCVSGTAMSCDDSNACTLDFCSPRSGMCGHPLIDADLDGHAASSLGTCGDDCNDTDATIYPGARDVCDGRDNDCDTTIDEDGVSTWYADCDDDDYAATGARTSMSCAEPAPGAAMCTSGGGWTVRSPATSADCNDGNMTVNPGQTMYQTTGISGAPTTSDFDYDCDGDEEQRDTVVAECTSLGPAGACRLARAGWVPPALGVRVPACGVTADYVDARGSCMLVVGGGCRPVANARRTQACR